MTQPTFTSTRLILRPPRLSDAEDIYLNINDWDVVSMIARPPWPYPRALADEFARTSTASVIEYEGKVIGAVGIGRPQHGYSLGFWLGKRFWGRGLMTEAAATLIAAFFRDIRDEPLNASYLLENQASWRVLEKLGFVPIARCSLRINSRDAELPGMQMRLMRETFEARLS